jgi:hypothetical protein
MKGREERVAQNESISREINEGLEEAHASSSPDMLSHNRVDEPLPPESELGSGYPVRLDDRSHS